MKTSSFTQLALAVAAPHVLGLRVDPAPKPVAQQPISISDIDPWHPGARAAGRYVLRIYASAEAYAAARASEAANAAGLGVAALFNFEHQRAASCPSAKPMEYWNDPRIHNFGNCGWRGFLHALVVPLATHAIDRFAYDGVDVRKLIHETVIPEHYEVVDLGCGVGFSPARNGNAVGVDSSAQMLRVARLRRPDVRFEQGNSESWGESGCCDMAAVMYNMHEMPAHARRRVLRNAQRLARRTVLIVDIWPGFEPTPMMLAGEPYVLDYLEKIDGEIEANCGKSWRVSRVDIVPSHVTMWRLDRCDYGGEDPTLDWGI